METEKQNNESNGNTVLLTVIGVATLLVALVGATFAYFSATITNNQRESVIITTAAPVGLRYEGETVSLTNIIPGASNFGIQPDGVTDNGEPSKFTVRNPDGTKTEDGGNGSTVAQTYDLDLVVDALGTKPDGTPQEPLTNIHTPQDEDPTSTDTTQTIQNNQLIVTITGESTEAGSTTKGGEKNVNNAIKFNTTFEGSPSYITATQSEFKIDLTDGATTNGKSYKFIDNQRIEIGEVQTYTVKVEFKELGVNQNENQGKNFNAHIEISDPMSVR